MIVDFIFRLFIQWNSTKKPGSVIINRVNMLLDGEGADARG